jgi:hypothetical protein
MMIDPVMEFVKESKLKTSVRILGHCARLPFMTVGDEHWAAEASRVDQTAL